MSSKSVRQYVTSRDGLLTHRIIMVATGMGCFFIPSVGIRLLSISVGTWTGWLAQFGTWHRLRGSAEMVAEGQIMMLGIVITLLLKYLNASTNPLWATTDWWSGGWNITGLILATAALYEYAHRPLDLHPAPLTTTTHTKNKPNLQVQTTTFQRIAITLGLGSLIHMIQTFVSDPGTIIAWTWTGYPLKGPTLHPFAGAVMAVACLGIIFGQNRIVSSIDLLGCAGAFILYRFPDWFGFVGGLVLVFYLVAITPGYLRLASILPPAPTFGGALLVNCIMDVVSVVTAAYAFVPYGWIFRERTDVVISICMVTICVGVVVALTLDLPGPERLYPRSVARIQGVGRRSKIAAIILAILALGAGYSKMPSKLPVPYYPEHRIFSGGIWAVSYP